MSKKKKKNNIDRKKEQRIEKVSFVFVLFDSYPMKLLIDIDLETSKKDFNPSYQYRSFKRNTRVFYFYRIEKEKKKEQNM